MIEFKKRGVDHRNRMGDSRLVTIHYRPSGIWDIGRLRGKVATIKLRTGYKPKPRSEKEEF